MRFRDNAGWIALAFIVVGGVFFLDFISVVHLPQSPVPFEFLILAAVCFLVALAVWFAWARRGPVIPSKDS